MRDPQRDGSRALAVMGVLLFLGLAVGMAILPYAYAQNNSSANQANAADQDGVLIAPNLAAIISIVAAVAGAAVGYGLAMGRLSATLSAHLGNGRIHQDVQALSQVFMPRAEVVLLAETIVQKVRLQSRAGGEAEEDSDAS